MKYERAEDVEELHLTVGEELELESLRAAVVPPHLFLMPFVVAPDELDVEGQAGFDEEGVHGSVFHLRANKPGEGELVVGFRDFRTQEVTHQKAIHVSIEEPVAVDDVATADVATTDVAATLHEA
jgi:hypothetical protein